MTGWNTAEVTRNDVPDQKASIAVPRSFSVMTGRAMEREVASRAAARVMIQMLMKAKRKPLPGLKAGWKFSRGARAGVSRDSERDCASGEEGTAGEGFSSMDEPELAVGDDIVMNMKHVKRRGRVFFEGSEC
jgi:hypothetical protein